MSALSGKTRQRLIGNSRLESRDGKVKAVKKLSQ